MKTNIIVAAISSIVSIFIWETMHVVSGVDAPKTEKTNNQFIWRKHI